MILWHCWLPWSQWGPIRLTPWVNRTTSRTSPSNHVVRLVRSTSLLSAFHTMAPPIFTSCITPYPLTWHNRDSCAYTCASPLDIPCCAWLPVPKCLLGIFTGIIHGPFRYLKVNSTPFKSEALFQNSPFKCLTSLPATLEYSDSSSSAGSVPPS